MKRLALMLTFLLLCVFLGVVVLNKEVVSKQCVDYQCGQRTIPLYLKILDFFDRHYNYKHLVNSITKDVKNNDDAAIRILEWTNVNIRRSPEGFSVIDDHIWYTIIRGYAVDDQFQDIFTTLCNYAGLEAFFCWLLPQDGSGRRPFSFVKLDRGWSVFDAYNGVYFKNKEGQAANAGDLSNGNWKAIALSGKAVTDDYAAYFSDISAFPFKDYKLSRPSIQSPFRRFLFWLNSKSRFSH